MSSGHPQNDQQLHIPNCAVPSLTTSFRKDRLCNPCPYPIDRTIYLNDKSFPAQPRSKKWVMLDQRLGAKGPMSLFLLNQGQNSFRWPYTSRKRVSNAPLQTWLTTAIWRFLWTVGPKKHYCPLTFFPLSFFIPFASHFEIETHKLSEKFTNTYSNFWCKILHHPFPRSAYIAFF